VCALIQEDKEGLFDAIKTLISSLRIATGVTVTLKPHPKVGMAERFGHTTHDTQHTTHNTRHTTHDTRHTTHNTHIHIHLYIYIHAHAHRARKLAPFPP